jgi:hypothetical protein
MNVRAGTRLCLIRPQRSAKVPTSPRRRGSPFGLRKSNSSRRGIIAVTSLKARLARRCPSQHWNNRREVRDRTSK